MTSIQVMCFVPNPQAGNNRSKFTATFQGAIVFASDKLDIMIGNEGLVYKSIRVILTRFEDQGRGYYLASPVKDKSMLILPDIDPFKEAPTVIIDAANFLYSVKHCGLNAENALNAILGKFSRGPRSIKVLYSPREIKSHIELFHELAQVAGIELIEMPEKVMANGTIKRTVDMGVAMAIARETTLRSKTKVIVLCTGDSDLVEPALMWLGANSTNDFSHLKSRQLVVVSSRAGGSISTEMLELCGHKNAQLVLLDELRKAPM